VVLGDVLEPSTRTRRQAAGRWLDLPRLLQQVPAGGGRLLAVVSERKWPTASQAAALVDALAQQPRLGELALLVSEEMERLGSSVGLAALAAQLCGGLAGRAPHVTSLQLHTARAAGTSLDDVCSSLAQLQGLRELVLTTAGKSLNTAGLSPLGMLTGLTALTISLRPPRDWQAHQDELDLLQHLGRLSRLERFCMVANALAPVVQLPAWPRLRHLQLDTTSPRRPQLLQLSAEHCSQLEHLEAAQVQVPEGVGSMPHLTSLRAACFLRLPEGAPALHLMLAAAAGGQQPALLLQLPQLKRLSVKDGTGPTYSLAQALELAGSCPLLEELDLASFVAPHQQQEQQQAGEALALLQASQLPLRRLKLPSCGWERDRRAALGQWLQGLVAQHAAWLLQPLEQLTLSHGMPADQQQLLSGCAALRELRLAIASPAVLARLPAGLTALGAIVSSELDQAHHPEGPAAQLPATQLTALRRLDLWTSYRQQLPVVELSQLTGLTFLRYEGSGARGASLAAGLSCLRRLVVLQCAPAAGMAEACAWLQGLTSLRMDNLGWAEVGELQAQAQQLAALTQLRQLVLGPAHGLAEQVHEMALALGRALPHCLVRLSACVNEESRLLEAEDDDSV
jgi:hypothetical protein